MSNTNITTTTVCPDNKEINPVTGRCVIKCKVGTVRNNITGKCDKDPNVNVKRGRPPKNKPGVQRLPGIPAIVAKVPQGNPKIKVKSPIHKKPASRASQASQASSLASQASSLASRASRASQSSHSSHSSDASNASDRFELYYPDLNDPEFTTKINNNKEFLIHKIPDYPVIKSEQDFDEVSNKLCGKFDKMLYQYFAEQFISYRTPYKSVMLYHGVGVGKTCSAITIAEALLSSQATAEPMIWVIMPQSLKTSFKSQVFNIDDFDTLEGLSGQCTDKTYIRLLNIYKSTFNKDNRNDKDNKEYREKLKSELKALLKTRYDIFTYDRFAKYIKDNYSNKIVENKVIIIDEAHNIRSTNKKVKDTYLALMKCLEKGVNNRLILLSATPMYNEPRDILELLKLLIINDKRTNIIDGNKKIFNNKTFNIEDANVIKLITNLSSTYISYLKGKNPFTFALKLNPSSSGIKVLEVAPKKDMGNNVIKKENLNWLKNIDDEIVISKLGEAQKNMLVKLEKKGMNASSASDASDDDADADDDDDGGQNNNMKLLQPMNIVYDNDIGVKGFYNFFSKTKSEDPIELKYTERYKNALLPDEEHLGKYSGKFLNVCNFIRKSKGIVVIYSRFLLSGIIPIAISLEHLGYSREGTTNILAKADIVKDKPVYEGITVPKYCILTSDKKEYMGNTKIDDLIKVINSPANYNGAKIKVILITPVASEGLSFYNTREIHLIEPWYHFNRADQIIGRGIRNCRHNGLNIENRNVSVFMHASVNDDENRESIDINAFRISTRKYIESKKVDKLIMDNAIDCHLMKNINYFPKTNFKLDNITIETSQGARIKYNFGDKEIDEPKCNGDSPSDSRAVTKLNIRGYRSELYKHLLPSIKNNIRGAIKNIIDSRNVDANANANANRNIYIDLHTLKNHIGYKVDNDILMYALKNILYPNIFINNKYITRYKDGILISPINILSNDRADGANRADNINKIIRYDNSLLLKSIDTNMVAKKATKASPRNARDDSDASDAGNASGNASNASDGEASKNKKAVQKILDKIGIALNDKNHTTLSFYLKVDAEDFKTLIGFILKSYPSTQTDDFEKRLAFLCECMYIQGILIKGEDIPSYTDSNNEYIGYINMYSDNTDEGNQYIQYKDYDDKAVKTVNKVVAIKYRNYTEYLKMIDETQVKSIKDNIKLYNVTTQKEQNVRPASKYITEYFSNRINNKVYIPQLMEKEKTAWGIIARIKNKYVLKIFTTGDGKKTGRVCESYTDEDHKLIITQLASVASADVKMKNKKLLCSHIGDLLLRKNKLILFPLYKPKV